MIQSIARQTGGRLRKVRAVLGLPHSSFHHAAAPTPRAQADAQIGALLETIFQRHRRRYGYRRLAQKLADQGVVCPPARLRRLMAERGLRALQPKSDVPRTSDGRPDQPSPNLLHQQPLPTAPNQVWAGDSNIPTAQGWLYLAVVIDLCSRRILGWSLGTHLRAELVVAALRQARQTRAVHHTIFHSDRGSQYGSALFRRALAAAGLGQSMSARANPDDNAWTEFFHRSSQTRNAPGRRLRGRHRRPSRNLRLHRRLRRHPP